MAKYYVCVLGVIAVILGSTSASTEDELNAVRAAVRPVLDGCGQAFGISREQMRAAAGNVYGLNPCFYACFYKKIGFMDANGYFDPYVAVEKNKVFFRSAEDIAKNDQVARTCSAVNYQSVSDGANGCERARLLVSCFLTENAPFTPFAAS